MSSTIKYPVFMPQQNYYVPVAHVYKFDNESWLAIRCPTVPALYISHEKMDPSTHTYYLRMINPHIDQYIFDFESARHVTGSK